MRRKKGITVSITIAQLLIAAIGILVLIALFAGGRYRVAGANEADGPYGCQRLLVED